MINSKQKRHLLLLYRSAMVFFVLNFSTIFAFAQVSRYFGQIPVGNSDTNGFVRIDKVFCDIPLGMEEVRNYFSNFRQIRVRNQNTWGLIGQYRFLSRM